VPNRPAERGTAARLRQVAVRPQQVSLELRCLDPRCGTLLPRDAELCDECGGTALALLGHSEAVLIGDAGERPVGFGLVSERPNVIGRGSPGLDIDLIRFPGSDSVHRHHAEISRQASDWSISHLGRNPLVISRADATVVVQPGATEWLRSGDWLQIGRIRLRFIIGRGVRPQG
jgi:FHA domain